MVGFCLAWSLVVRYMQPVEHFMQHLNRIFVDFTPATPATGLLTQPLLARFRPLVMNTSPEVKDAPQNSILNGIGGRHAARRTFDAAF